MINKKRLNKICIVAFLLFILYAAVVSTVKLINLQKSPVYTIGKLYKVHMGSTGVSPSAFYTYKVKNINIDMSCSFSSTETFNIGSRYFVKFEKDNPKNSEILLDKPVPISILDSPSEGWTKIPSY